MDSYFSNTILALVILPFIGTVILAFVINKVTNKNKQVYLVSASSGIATAWICALIVGVPNFPPEISEDTISYLIIAGLLIGTLLDHFLPSILRRLIYSEFLFDLVFFVTVILCMRGNIDIWFIIIIFPWSLILLRTRRQIASPKKLMIMTIMVLLGLITITSIYGNLTDTYLGLGSISAIAGLLICLTKIKDLQLGFSFYWATFSMPLLISLRIFEDNSMMIAPIFFLGFIYFADTLTTNPKFLPTNIQKLASSIILIAVSLLPIILASTATLVIIKLLDQ